MSIQDEQTQLNMRVPISLKRRLVRYCTAHELKVKHTVVQAIEEYLDRHERTDR